MLFHVLPFNLQSSTLNLHIRSNMKLRSKSCLCKIRLFGKTSTCCFLYGVFYKWVVSLYQHLSVLSCFLLLSVCLPVVQGKVRLWKVREKSDCCSSSCMLYFKTLRRQESVIYLYVLHLVWDHYHFQAAQKNLACASLFYTQFENLRGVTPTHKKYEQVSKTCGNFFSPVDYFMESIVIKFFWN